MKKFLHRVIILALCFLMVGCFEEEKDEKPVIYLYPEQKTNIRVELDYSGKLTTTYPDYEDGWEITAYPDGRLIDKKNNEYYCLFWEGEGSTDYDMSKGFVVAGKETKRFLEEKLSILGLTPREQNEFIIYWLPKMEHNKYNLISFQQEKYTDHAKLNIQPEPDSLLRVFMVYRPLQKPQTIEEQKLETFERKGFTVVEWGGCELN
ncbi:MAG: hypothetical protein Q4D77_06665 [Peptostreptococcaceae bacterium]|nr:hypothetical protein [Peptostreptococcaceae bacterium]